MSDAPSQRAALHRLFLALFLRGRTSRGLRKERAPRSIASRLGTTLLIYGLVGLFAIPIGMKSQHALALCLHAMTFVFLGMFVASSAGELLFNKEEADILLHRPVEPRTLLWAKVRVLVEVSLWIGGAFNLAGLCVAASQSGGALFVAGHVVSTVLEVLFCTGGVVVLYQLCLRWCGRERLEGLMTAAQMAMAIFFVLAGQLGPRLVEWVGLEKIEVARPWWIWLLPPAWFASLDEVLAGRVDAVSGAMAAGVVAVTVGVLVLAFGKLARDYTTGMQAVGETHSPPPRADRRGRRLLDALVGAPPLRWWLRDPVERASFLLCAAYLMRDRETKLRIYPGIVPMLAMPVVMMLNDARHDRGPGLGGFGIAFAGCFLGLVPLLAIELLQYSQQWQASDVFRYAPIAGPGGIAQGARRAVTVVIVVPMVLLVTTAIGFVSGGVSQLPLLLPGILALPLYTLLPVVRGRALPLSSPSEGAKAARRSFSMIATAIAASALAGLTAWSWSSGWYLGLVAGESVVVALAFAALRGRVARARWESID